MPYQILKSKAVTDCNHPEWNRMVDEVFTELIGGKIKGVQLLDSKRTALSYTLLLALRLCKQLHEGADIEPHEMELRIPRNSNAYDDTMIAKRYRAEWFTRRICKSFVLDGLLACGYLTEERDEQGRLQGHLHTDAQRQGEYHELLSQKIAPAFLTEKLIEKLDPFVETPASELLKVSRVTTFTVFELVKKGGREVKRLVNYRANAITRGFERFCEAVNKRMAAEGVDIRVAWRSIPKEVITSLLVRNDKQRRTSTYKLDAIPQGPISTDVHMSTRKGRQNDGGRLLAGGYQNIKREVRRYLTINGEPTVEVDMQANWPRLLYALHCETQYVGDPYVAVLDRMDWAAAPCPRKYLEADFRQLVKLTMIKMIGVSIKSKAVNAVTRTSPFKTWDVMTKEALRQAVGNPANIGAALVQLIEDTHPQLIPRFYKGEGWTCQIVEGLIARGVVEELLLCKPLGAGVVVLVEHDGYICKASEAEPVEAALLKVYKEYIGDRFSPVITRKEAPPC
ncbi:hypothetical protein P4E94_15730 [Pontiellaceae bacterium B12219]|nr:hypothetical protein [Pontiellaceae bacterium B12219]